VWGVVIGAGLLVVREAASRPAGFPVSEAVLPSSAPTSSQTAKADWPISLREDGLEIVDFGASGADAIAVLTDVLGEMDADDRWQCQEPAAEVRFVQWNDLSVFVMDDVFTGYVDSIYYPPQLGEPMGFETEEGLGIGSSQDELAGLYDGRLELREADTPFETAAQEFLVDGEDGIRGLVELEPTPRVILIRAGATCLNMAA
jgi:hypothetical protein